MEKEAKRERLTPRQQDVLDAIGDYVNVLARSEFDADLIHPSYAMIGQKLKISRQAVAKHVWALITKGYLKKEGKRWILSIFRT